MAQKNTALLFATNSYVGKLQLESSVEILKPCTFCAVNFALNSICKVER